MDESPVTWQTGRKGWMGRPRREVPSPAVPPPAEPVPVPAVIQLVVSVPEFPCFSPASVAQILKVYRSTVQYWLANGKLDSFQDNIGDRYVLRAELIRFIREYLKRTVDK